MTFEDVRAELEAAIESPPTDEAGRVRFMRLVLASVLAVPTATRAAALHEARPVNFPSPKGDCITAFTSAEAAEVTRNYAPFVIAIDGTSLVRQMSPEFGLAIASQKGIAVLDAGFLAKVREDLTL
ncbi:MAG: hypothetical protein HGA51_07610 [Demequinaceae bacterium]|nr:hypothetical protein [Demequinaceae bacterium]